MKLTPWQKEWNALIKQECRYLENRLEKKDTKLNTPLAEKSTGKTAKHFECRFCKSI